MAKTVMENAVIVKGKRSKIASFEMNIKSTAEKNAALTSIAQQLITDQQQIITENAKDLVAGKEMGLSDATLDRIMLNKERITAMSEAILQLVELADPVGEVLEDIRKE